MSRSQEAEPRPSLLVELSSRYRAERRRVDDARLQMLTITFAPHRPAEARVAAAQLTRALRAATATASRALQVVAATPSPRRPRRRRKATRTEPPATLFWATELVRLAEISVWLRRETLDDLGVHVPTAVRVGSRAATGPHIAGLVADPDDLVAATLHEPWIGVDLRATVDATTVQPTSSRRASVSAPAHITRAA